MGMKEVRSKEVKAYFTEKEKQKIKELAEKQERSVSGFVRWKILQEIKPEVTA